MEFIDISIYNFICYMYTYVYLFDVIYILFNTISYNIVVFDEAKKVKKKCSSYSMFQFTTMQYPTVDI